MREREGERENSLLKKDHGAMSVVVMNIVKQLSINVELQVQHLSRPDSTEYCGSLLWKSSESELEALVFQIYLRGIYLSLGSWYMGHGDVR